MTKPCKCCKNEIHDEASKCVNCGCSQGWTRHIDIGNTSLALLIALISTVSLLFDKVDKWISSDEAKVIGKIIDVTPKGASVFISNNGLGTAILGNGLLCSIWPIQNSSDIYTYSKGKLLGSQYPTKENVVGRYIYFYENSQKEPVFFKPGENRVIQFKFRELLIQKDDIPTDKKEIKSYCTWPYDHQDGKGDIFFEFIDSIKMDSFALDSEFVKPLLKSYLHK